MSIQLPEADICDEHGVKNVKWGYEKQSILFKGISEEIIQYLDYSVDKQADEIDYQVRVESDKPNKQNDKQNLHINESLF